MSTKPFVPANQVEAELFARLSAATARVAELEEESRSGAWTQLKYMAGGEELICELTDKLSAATARASELERELAQWRTSASMACESPPDRCDCAGCRFAEQLNVARTEQET